MANSPVTPAQLTAALPTPTKSICDNMVNALIRFPTLMVQIFSWLLNADGSFSDAFKSAISSFMLKPGDLIFSAAIDNSGTDRLLCDGSTVSQSTYPDLYAAIGNTYLNGATIGAGLFRVPDYRTKFPVGVGASYPLGGTGGVDAVTLTVNQLPPHHHRVDHAGASASGNVSDPTGGLLAAGAGSDYNFTSADAGGGAAHNNLPPYVCAYVYIKT